MTAFEQPAGPCKRCQANPATVWWVGEGGGLALAHGFKKPWCERCCIEVLLEYARTAAAGIQDLENKLAVLGGPFAKEKP